MRGSCVVGRCHSRASLRLAFIPPYTLLPTTHTPSLPWYVLSTLSHTQTPSSPLFRSLVLYKRLGNTSSSPPTFPPYAHTPAHLSPLTNTFFAPFSISLASDHHRVENKTVPGDSGKYSRFWRPKKRTPLLVPVGTFAHPLYIRKPTHAAHFEHAQETKFNVSSSDISPIFRDSYAFFSDLLRSYQCPPASYTKYSTRIGQPLLVSSEKTRRNVAYFALRLLVCLSTPALW